MSYQHKELAAGRWKELSFVEQMANIGSEIERALNWQAKNNPAYARQAFYRALELFDLTLAGLKAFPRLKEVARLREAAVDYFWGENQFKFSRKFWQKYFLSFTYAAQKFRQRRS